VTDDHFARRERALPAEARATYFAEIERALKDEDTYVVWAWALGGLGAHRFYLNQPDKALLHVAMFPTGVALAVWGIVEGRADLVAAGAFLVVVDVGYWIHDLVKIRTIVGDKNREIRSALLDKHEGR